MPPPDAASTTTPAPSTSPKPTPRELKTIVTVVSSPYCNALAEHFNSALVPMLANDRTFDATSIQLDDMNDMFSHPDYVNRFMNIRVKMQKYSGVLIASLKPMQAQIDALKASAALTKDADAAKQMTDAAFKLQQAYNHQFQLSTDLESLTQAMMDYNIMRGSHPLSGWTPYEQSLPADEKNIKVYLHFDKQRASIDQSESEAVDIAYAAAQAHCTKP